MQESRNPVVVVCGSIHIDTFVEVPALPQVGETVVATNTVRALGGKGANQAIAVANAGVEAIMAGTIGEDPEADFVLEKLTAKGVDTHSVQTSWEQPTGSAFIASGPNNRPIIFVQRGAGELTDPADFADEFAQADIVLAQGELAPAATNAIAATASLHNTRFVLNLNPVSTVTPALIDNADPLIVNRPGAWQIVRELGMSEGLNAVDTAAHMEALLQYCPTVIITMGHEGCIYSDPETGNFYHQSTLHIDAESIVDTTGSGDAFVGTLTAELARGTDLSQAIRLATCAGTKAVQAVGATAGLVSHDELVKLAASEDLPARTIFKAAEDR